MFLLTLYRIRPFSASISFGKKEKKKKPYSRGGKKREREKQHPSNPGTEQVLFATVNPSDEISANPHATMSFSAVDFPPCSIQSSTTIQSVLCTVMRISHPSNKNKTFCPREILL